MVIEPDECGFGIGLRHQDGGSSQAAAHVGHHESTQPRVAVLLLTHYPNFSTGSVSERRVHHPGTGRLVQNSQREMLPGWFWCAFTGCGESG